MTSVVVITPPAPLVTVEMAKAWAPVLAGDEDARVEALLAAAQAALEPPSWLGSSLGEQTLELRMDGFGWCGDLALPYGPVQSVASVKYDDDIDVPDTVWALSDAGTILARLKLLPGQSWPPAAGETRIRYVAGYAADDPKLLPAKHAIVLSAVHMRSLSSTDLALRTVDVDGVDSRTYVVSDAAEKLVKGAVENLLNGYRVWAV